MAASANAEAQFNGDAQRRVDLDLPGSSEDKFFLSLEDDYDGFLPTQQIQPLSYFSNICTSE